MSSVPNDLVGSLLPLLGIPFLLFFSFFLFPKVIHSISRLSSKKRDDANRRRELLRLLVLSELTDSCLLDSDSSGKGDCVGDDLKKNDDSVAIDSDPES